MKMNQSCFEEVEEILPFVVDTERAVDPKKVTEDDLMVFNEPRSEDSEQMTNLILDNQPSLIVSYL
jgi:hypothetical protein